MSGANTPGDSPNTAFRQPRTRPEGRAELAKQARKTAGDMYKAIGDIQNETVAEVQTRLRYLAEISFKKAANDNGHDEEEADEEEDGHAKEGGGHAPEADHTAPHSAAVATVTPPGDTAETNHAPPPSATVATDQAASSGSEATHTDDSAKAATPAPEEKKAEKHEEPSKKTKKTHSPDGHHRSNELGKAVYGEMKKDNLRNAA